MRAMQPAEWAPHEAVWVAWPSDARLWGNSLEAAQDAFVAMCEVIARPGDRRGDVPRERVDLLVPDERRKALALRRLEQVAPRVHVIPYGDIWLRDTAPVFVRTEGGAPLAACFAFNGWGGKYVLDGDAQVSERIARASGVERISYDWVLEGGSVEVDGEGTILTTRQCLLNANRNPSFTQSEIEKRLCDALGGTKVLWLDEGLRNDHTDGHVDTLARFVAPGVVVCMMPCDSCDPNRDTLEALRRDLGGMQDARGRALEIVSIPSPGRIESLAGEVMPASYVNFYIGNHSVVVPTYGAPQDEQAVKAIGALFPGRHTQGIDARAILTGGGAFHCITQQQPTAERS
jgi:agmatine deiminase